MEGLCGLTNVENNHVQVMRGGKMTEADVEKLVADDEGEMVCNRRQLWHCQ